MMKQQQQHPSVCGGLLVLLLFVLASSVVGQDVGCIHCSEYEDLSASDKESVLLSRVMSSQYPNGQLPQKTLCDPVELLTQAEEELDMSNFFDRFSDERPRRMMRLNHYEGIIASVRFEGASNSPFTGVFKGADHGIMRWSATGIPPVGDRLLTEFLVGTLAGSMGLKLFRDGAPSANILANDAFKDIDAFVQKRGWRFWADTDYNIFRRPLDTMPGLDLPQFLNIPFIIDVVLGINDRVKVTFGQTEKYTGVLGNLDAALYDVDGTEEETPVTPIGLAFRPNPDLTSSVERFGKVEKDFRTWAVSEDYVPAGTLLYSAWTTLDGDGNPSICFDDTGVPQTDAEGVAENCPDQRRVHVGDLYTKSRFFTSKWGDEGLFFRHDRVCPKDHVVCTLDTAGWKPSDVLDPFPSLSRATDKLCIGDNRVDGTFTDTPPDCPPGSTSTSVTTCLPTTTGGQKTVTEQLKQCPIFAAGAHPELLGEAAGRDNVAVGCGTVVRFGLVYALEPSISGLVNVLRFFRRMFNLLFGWIWD